MMTQGFWKGKKLRRESRAAESVFGFVICQSMQSSSSRRPLKSMTGPYSYLSDDLFNSISAVSSIPLQNLGLPSIDSPSCTPLRASKLSTGSPHADASAHHQGRHRPLGLCFGPRSSSAREKVTWDTRPTTRDPHATWAGCSGEDDDPSGNIRGLFPPSSLSREQSFQKHPPECGSWPG